MAIALLKVLLKFSDQSEQTKTQGKSNFYAYTSWGYTRYSCFIYGTKGKVVNIGLKVASKSGFNRSRYSPT